MSTTKWTGTDGNWTGPTWTNGVPDASLNAVIEGTQSSPITVTFDAPNGAAQALLMEYATLAVSGGTLALETESRADALNQTGGLLDLLGGSEFDGPVMQSAGTIEVNYPYGISIDDGGSFGGTLTGSGLLLFAVGAVTLDPGLVLSVGSVVVENTTTLAGNITDHGQFTLAADGTLALAGHVFAANAGSRLSGVVEGPGVLGIGAHSVIDELTATDGATIHDYGTVYAGPLTLDTATLAIGPGAYYELDDTIGILGSNRSVIEVDGVLEDSALGTTSISGGIIEDAGIIENGNNDLLIAAGTFACTGTGEASAGFGTIAFGPGVVTANLVNGTLTGGIWWAEAGALLITGGPITTDAATIDLVSVAGYPALAEFAAGNGTTFTPIQDSLTTITEGGVLDVSGQSYVTTNNFVDNGTLELSGGDQFGSLSIGATGELKEVDGPLTAASIWSAGTVYTGGDDTEPSVVLQAPFTSTGTLYSQQNWLILAGADNLIQGAAFVSSAIVLDPDISMRLGSLSGDSFINDLRLGAGDTLTLGASFADHGAFSAPNASTVDLGGYNLTFDGTAILGPNTGAPLQVDGNGTLAFADPHAGGGLGVSLGDVAVAGGVSLDNRGYAEVGTLTLGDAAGGTASLVNQVGATLVMLGTSAIDVAEPSADTVTNAGLLEQTLTGTSVVGANFTNTGTIDITSGTLEITGAFINSGVIIGTETQADGTTYITAASDPSLTLFNQYRAATTAPAAETFALPPTAHVNPPVLASPGA